MSNILVLNSSINVTGSVSRSMVSSYVAAQRLLTPDATIVERDLVTHPLPAMTPDLLPFYLGQSSAHMGQGAHLCDTLIREVEEADILVLGLAMYNFSVPASIKAWLDYIVCAGRTFHYTENGPQGMLAQGKRVIALVASGGIYSEGPSAPLDFLVPYVTTLLGMVGLTDIRVVRAEGTAMGNIEAIRARAIAQASGLAG